MKPHDSIWVVRRWCDACTDPSTGVFDNLEGLNNGHLTSQRGYQVHELANILRLGTTVLSQDLNGVWVTVCR
jgi:hypothetical protein